MRYYIAYGSNLNVRQMRARCPGARITGISAIEGYELLFKGNKLGAYLTIEPKAGASVPVAVWEVSEKNELALDHYEGFPKLYYKTDMVLPVRFLRTGAVRRCRGFVYIMYEKRSLGLPRASYMADCRAGYHDVGFDEAFLAQALQRSLSGRLR